LIVKGFIVLVSNFVIKEEVIILTSLGGLGTIWFVFVLLAGLCVVHEYSMAVNLKTLVVTAVAAFIIIFLGILFFTLIERMYYFVVSVFQETIRRLN
jgi:hypothetical protein